MFEAKRNETEDNKNTTPATGAEGKAAAAEGIKPAEDAKKPVKKKKIIIVTGSNTQGGQRGAYSSGSGAYNSGSGASRGAAGQNRGGAARGANRSGSTGSAQGGNRSRQQRPADGRTGDRSGRDARGTRGAGTGRGRTTAAPVRKLIKPTIRQTQMEVDYHKPVQQPRKSDAVRRAEAEAKKAAEAAAAKAAEAEAAAKAAAQETEAAAAETTAAAPAVSAASEAPAQAQAPVQTGTGAAAASDRSDADSKGQRTGEQSARQASDSRAANTETGRGGSRQGSDSRSGRSGANDRGGRGGAPRAGQDSRDSRGGRPGSDSRGGRPGSDSRGGRGGASRGGADSRGGSARPGQGAAPGRGDKNRGKGYQDKDRRSRKDQIYNEDDKNQSRKNRAGRFIRPEKKEAVPAEEQIKTISVPEKISIRDLAERMHLQAAEIIKKLFLQGKMMTPNSEVSYEEAEEIALGYDILCEKEQKVDVIEELLREEEEDESEMVSRPPVICVMGHVDHGKTSLLDAIRSTNVTGKEAGGITQAIGAYMVSIDGRDITFLDTPGHEAFTAMRMRGANSTDIAILVVAADDGVMPQTIEAINHAKAAGVEIIVAINKIDKPAANPDHVKQQLAELELIPEDWGGDTIMVPVSAHTHEGIDDLLEMILLVAEVKELKANPKLPAHGVIVEAKLDKGRGPVATVLVQRGTLTIGDYIIAGTAHGRVRALVNDRGEKVRKAGPSVPVEVLGLNEVPQAGDILDAADEKVVRAIAEKRIAKAKAEQQKAAKVSLDDIFNRIKEGELKDLNIVVKADVQGSVEALCASLLKIQNDEVKTVIVHSGVGAINESDVMLASAANALIIGFNVRPDANARKVAEQEKVDIRLYRIIYDAINDVEAAVKGMLAPKFEEDIIGRVEVRQVITISKLVVAGCYVTEGKVTNNAKIRVYRDDIVIAEDEMESLRRFKDDVKEVQAGFECGITLAKFHDIKVGDQFEVYVMKEVAPQ